MQNINQSQKENCCENQCATCKCKVPMIVGAFVFAITMLVLGIFLGKTFFSSAKQNSGILTTPTVSVVPTTTEATSGAFLTASNAPVANWRTYKNEKYGFEFKYPTNFTLTDTLPSIMRVTTAKENLGLKDSINDTQMTVIVNTAGFGPFFPNELWELDYAKEKGIFLIKKTENDPIKYRQDNYFEIVSPQAKTISGKLLSFMFRYPKTRDYKSLFSQILSTFKFTEK